MNSRKLSDNRFSRIFLVLVATIAWAGVPLASAAEEHDVAGKIVFVNFEKIYRESKAVTAIRDRVNAEFREREQALKEMTDSYAEKQQELQKETLGLSADKKESMHYELDQLRREIEREGTGLQEDKGLRISEERQKLDNRIAQIVQKLAEANKYRMVLVQNILLYADGTSDISPQVITELDSDG